MNLTGKMGLITLLTDFGNQDGYVGMMKGVILTINPLVRLVDIAHDISPGDIESAAFVLARTVPYFPEGTIHVVVVDPGVGSDRRAFAAFSNGCFFVAPDNGVLKWILSRDRAAQVYSLDCEKYFLKNISLTFHGRDIFAPVAAHLSTGRQIAAMGTRIQDYNVEKMGLPEKNNDLIKGEIIYIDRFGNLVTNIPADFLEGGILHINIRHSIITHLSRSYAQESAGTLLAIHGSHGNLEIAVANGSAARKLEVKIGEPVILRLKNE
ncbi:SAM-dependent chlorinase/fluorinase [candidate division KSB1 bacterium]|nr:SAM-dependent chlorinase/fluorinase [candidate division KSB1 bacterium]